MVIGVPGYRCAGIPVYSVSVYMCTSAPGGCGGGDGEQEEHKIQFAHRMYLSCGGGEQQLHRIQFAHRMYLSCGG